MSLAFLFPGQGSQAVGMGAALADAFPSARLVFEEVDDALGQKLSKLMREGPEGDLTLTENAQPALMAVSLAAARAGTAATAARARAADARANTRAFMIFLQVVAGHGLLAWSRRGARRRRRCVAVSSP